MIDSGRVTEILYDCFIKEGEKLKDASEITLVNGIIHKFGFHTKRLQSHAKELNDMIDQLPESFTEGMSFLNMCMTKNDEQWTGLPQIQEQLMVLGIAIGRIEYCAPREMWYILPGGMPYIRVKERKEE
jgi:hypothetical protein